MVDRLFNALQTQNAHFTGAELAELMLLSYIYANNNLNLSSYITKLKKQIPKQVCYKAEKNLPQT